MSSDTVIKCARRKLTLQGIVGIANAADLRDKLLPLLKRQSAVTLDFSGAERLDTAALQVLAAFVADARSREIPVRWAGISDAARSAITLTGMAVALDVQEHPV